MTSRQALHVLIDEIPDRDLSAARRFLEYLRAQTKDPLQAALDSAPVDDESLTVDDLEAIQQGLEEYERGDVVSHEEVQRRLREAR